MAETRNIRTGIDKSVWIFALLYFTLIFFGLFANAYVYLLLIGICCAVSLFANIKTTYYNLFFLLPYAMVIKLSPRSTSLFTIYMLAATLILAFKIMHFGHKSFLLLLLFSVYLLFGTGGNITLFIKLVCSFILLFYFIITVDIEDTKNYVMSFALGLIGSSFLGGYKLGDIRVLRYFSDLNAEYIGGVKTYRFSGLYLDPNYYTVCVISVLLLSSMLLMKKKVSKLPMLPIMGVLIYYGGLSYSKIYVVGLALIVFFVVQHLLSGSRKLGATMFGLLLAFVVGYYVIINTEIFAGFVDRFSDADISNNRFNIWSNYFTYILSEPMCLLFGVGIKNGYYNGVGPHNTYIEILYFLGATGTALYFLLLKHIMGTRRLLGKRMRINYALVVTFAIMIGTLGLFSLNDTMFIFMLSWLGLNMDMQKESMEIQENN